MAKRKKGSETVPTGPTRRAKLTAEESLRRMEEFPKRRELFDSEVRMVYKVALHHSEEGYSVSVPGLPGCCSQGATEEEALENIADAIREYLEVGAELEVEDKAEVREVEVRV